MTAQADWKWKCQKWAATCDAYRVANQQRMDARRALEWIRMSKAQLVLDMKYQACFFLHGKSMPHIWFLEAMSSLFDCMVWANVSWSNKKVVNQVEDFWWVISNWEIYNWAEASYRKWWKWCVIFWPSNTKMRGELTKKWCWIKCPNYVCMYV